MSAFDDLWSEIAEPLLTEQFAGTAFCTPVGGSQISVTATVWAEGVIEEHGSRGEVIRKHVRRVSVPRNAVAANGGTFLDRPSIRDEWAIDGVVYTVDAIESQTASETVVRLLRIDVHEKARDGFRRKN